MGGILNKYITIIVEVLLFAIFITFVAVFSSSAKMALNLKTESNVAMSELQTYREVYSYIRADEISGDDVVRFVELFKRLCDVQIIKGANTYTLSAVDVTSNAWEGTEVMKFLDTDILKRFNVSAVRDEYSNTYTSITFTMK